MRIALIGFGVVGQGLARILRDKSGDLTREFGFSSKIVAVYTPHKGSLHHPDGLNIDALLSAAESATFDSYPEMPGLRRNLTSDEIIRQSNAEVIVEVSPTDIVTAEPALSHIRAALDSAKHVVTANKGPVALAYSDLVSRARQSSVHFGFRGTVMSGTPTLWLGLQGLVGNAILDIRGILNGTTNYILTQMENGKGYAEALAEAQQLGYAEADPTADVEGWDTLSKVLILANTIMGGNLTVQDIPCRGISQLTLSDLTWAKQNSQRWKLIGSIWRDGNFLMAKVEPMPLSINDPLANVIGVTNAITYSTDLLGNITLVGPGAGASATGSALLADLLEIHKTTKGK